VAVASNPFEGAAHNTSILCYRLDDPDARPAADAVTEVCGTCGASVFLAACHAEKVRDGKLQIACIDCMRKTFGDEKINLWTRGRQ
jgi:hypothetical protein